MQYARAYTEAGSVLDVSAQRCSFFSSQRDDWHHHTQGGLTKVVQGRVLAVFEHNAVCVDIHGRIGSLYLQAVEDLSLQDPGPYSTTMCDSPRTTSDNCKSLEQCGKYRLPTNSNG